MLFESRLTRQFRDAIAALAARGDIGMTEAYRDPCCDAPDVKALNMVAMLNVDTLHPYIFGHRWQALMTAALYILNRNNRSGCPRNGQLRSGRWALMMNLSASGAGIWWLVRHLLPRAGRMWCSISFPMPDRIVCRFMGGIAEA